MKKSTVNFFFLSIFSSSLFAIDPVSWRLQPSTGFPETPIGHQSTVQYTLTNKLPLPTKIITIINTTGGGFNVHNECANATLNSGASCDISVGFLPETAGVSTFSLTYGYHNNRIPLPTLTAVATGQAAGQLQGQITGLPPTLYLNNTPDFTATYTNPTNATLTGCSNTPSFTLSGPGSIGVGVVSTGSTCGATLRPHSSCKIDGQLTNTNSGGSIIITGNMTCNQASARPKAETIVQNQTGCTVHGHTLLPLPTRTYRYADNVVKFQFENECAPGNGVSLGTVNISSNIAATITKPAIYDTCSNRVLDGGSDCTVIASVIPNSITNNMVITANVTAGSITASAQTSAPVLFNQQATHHVQFVNQCDFDVWYGIGNGPGGIYSPDPNLQAYPAGAPPSAYFLAKQLPGQRPSVIDLQVPVYRNGAIWPRTGCKMSGGQFVCITGTCATMPNSATCNNNGPLVQPLAPYTKFEFTIEDNPGQDGVYDVSVINGFTVPVEIKAFGPTTADPFNCTGAGALIQPQNSTLGSCPWMFHPTEISGLARDDFQWVRPGAEQACDASDPNCGRSFNVLPPANPAKIVERIAPFLGYSTLANYFGYPAAGQWGAPNLYEKYGIASPFPLPNNYNGANWSVLFACIPTGPPANAADSCYLNPAGPHCCGCVNWQNEPVGSPLRTDSSAPCNNANPDWTTNTPTNSSVPGFNIQKGITWLKAGCPTAYSYQFDDKSSSFQCNFDGATPLYTSYQITFCPGGVTGLPSGAMEGRDTAP